MKESNNERIDWTLVRKWMEGELSGDERERVERWLKADRARQRFVEQAGRYYRRDLPLVDEGRIERAWASFMRERRARRRRLWGVRWSAAAAVVLMMAGAWWLSGERRPMEVMPQPEIAVGSYRARLVISDGTSIDLAAGKPERILVDREVSVRVDSASLSYEPAAHAEDTVFHTVEVPRGGEFHLTLSDGTRVWLNAQSRLTYPLVFGKGERRVRLEGEGFFEVQPGRGRFVVETDPMDVRVLGTAFNVNAYHDEEMVRTTLVRGKVEILAANDSVCRVLAPGEQAALNRTDCRLEVKSVNTALYTQWMKGQFVFRDAPLSDIMRTLARWYEMEYEFSDPALASLCFYGVINRFERVENLLEQFEKTGRVRFEYAGNKVIVKK